MLGTILIYGGTIEERIEKGKTYISELEIPLNPNPDLFVLENDPEKKSIGIKETKNAIGWLIDRPFSAPHKALLIPQAEKLTLDAQNSLLKTLEDPPTKALIVLCTKREEDLIQTVISRCRKIALAKDSNSIASDVSGTNFMDIHKMDLATKLEKSTELSKLERSEVVDLLTNWENEIHDNLRNIETSSLINAYNIIREVRIDLEKTNVSIKFGLDYLMTQI